MSEEFNEISYQEALLFDLEYYKAMSTLTVEEADNYYVTLSLLGSSINNRAYGGI